MNSLPISRVRRFTLRMLMVVASVYQVAFILFALFALAVSTHDFLDFLVDGRRGKEIARGELSIIAMLLLVFCGATWFKRRVRGSTALRISNSPLR